LFRLTLFLVGILASLQPSSDNIEGHQARLKLGTLLDLGWKTAVEKENQLTFQARALPDLLTGNKTFIWLLF